MPAIFAQTGTPAKVSICAATLLVAALFYGARQPVAVGLFVAPWDKVAHAAVFAVLATLLAASRPQRYASMGWLLLCALAAAAVGAADELHQLSLPGRSAGLGDLAADTLGALLGVATWSALRHLAVVLSEKRNNC